MQVDNKFSRQIQKIESKLLFLNDVLSFDLSQEQKTWIETQSVTCNELVKTIKDLDRNSEYADRVVEDLYKNLRSIKRKIVAWLKFNKTDVQAFKDLKKRKGQEWVPLIDETPYPAKSSEISDADLCDINFPCLSYTNKELCQFSERILIEHNILTGLNISVEKLNTLVVKICNGYNSPAYHNFTHGFNVFQTVHYFFKKTETQMTLDKIEKFSSLIGALGHDLNHNGFNNAFEVKVKSENSIRYFDRSPLENMHASTLISILKDPEVNFFEWFSDPKDRVRFQELAVTLILATDMAYHNKELSKFTCRVKATREYQKLKNDNEAINQELEEKALLMDRAADKRTILKQVVHACDLANTCQKFDNYLYWAALLSQEFDYQTKKEEQRGVEVSVFLKYKDKPSFYAGQYTFAKTLSLPLWEQIAFLFGSIGEAVETLNENIKRLEQKPVEKPVEEK